MPSNVGNFQSNNSVTGSFEVFSGTGNVDDVNEIYKWNDNEYVCLLESGECARGILLLYVLCLHRAICCPFSAGHSLIGRPI